MKRHLAIVLCALALGCVITACGGGGTSSADKLTVVGSGA